VTIVSEVLFEERKEFLPEQDCPNEKKVKERF
jgi:hypothetical protein